MGKLAAAAKRLDVPAPAPQASGDAPPPDANGAPGAAADGAGAGAAADALLAAAAEGAGGVALSLPPGAKVDFLALVAAGGVAAGAAPGGGGGGATSSSAASVFSGAASAAGGAAPSAAGSAAASAAGGAGGAPRQGGTLWACAGQRVFMLPAGAATPKSELALPPKVGECDGSAAKKITIPLYPLPRSPATPPRRSPPTRQSNVTALAGGGHATVWTGHADGALRAHHRGGWDAARLPGGRAAVRALAVDAKGRAWAGDDAGLVRVVRFDPRARALSQIWQAPPGTGAGGAQPAPVAALLARGGWVVGAGGARGGGALTLWDAGRLAAVAAGAAEGRGPFTCLDAIDWDDGDDAAAGGGGGGGWRLLAGTGSGQVLLWEVSAAGLRLASAIGVPCGSAVRCAAAAPRGAEARGGRALRGRHCCAWPVPLPRRAHAVILNPHPHPPHCSGIALFPAQDIMVTAHADGTLHVYPLPSPRNGAAGAQGAETDASCPTPGGDAASWRPRAARIKAHRGGLVGATALVSGGP
jgi:hypothetical protein